MVSPASPRPVLQFRTHRKAPAVKPEEAPHAPRQTGGFATRTMLLLTLGLVVVGITAASLSILRARLHQQVERDVSSDLRRSIQTFASLHLQRKLTLQR